MRLVVRSFGVESSRKRVVEPDAILAGEESRAASSSCSRRR
jgi:hypothetical protein